MYAAQQIRACWDVACEHYLKWQTCCKMEIDQSENGIAFWKQGRSMLDFIWVGEKEERFAFIW